MTGAKLLVDALIAAGVDTIFGVPGDTSIAFYDELSRRHHDIRHVMARDERNAGYMADGYARSTQRLAACEASSGAGAVYLASGLAEAYGSSIPVLAVTTDIQRRSHGTGAITEVDQLTLFSAVTKWRRMVESAADIPRLVAEAALAARTGRPGPAVLVVPEETLEQHAGPTTPGAVPAVSDANEADGRTVTEFARRLAAADQPAILAGGGVHMGQAWAELRQLAEHSAIPVASTIHGKGALPEDHPLSLGVAGGNGCRGYANDYLRRCDALLVVGSRANATDTYGFRTPPPVGRAVGRIDVDPARAASNFPGASPLVGDAAAVLNQIREVMPKADGEVAMAREAQLRALREAWADGPAAEDLPSPGEGRLQPRDVVRLLHRTFGPSSWVVADAGTPTPNLAAYWESAGNGWRVIIPRGHGPMGYSISAAIGVAVAHPNERVLCLTTEGSLGMGMGDWETAQRLRLPITYVVMDNASMAWIKMLQHLYLNGRYFGVDPGPVDPVLLARGMGMRADLATDLDHLELLVKRELAANDGPCAIHVRVPEHLESPPPVAAWQAALRGELTQRPGY